MSIYEARKVFPPAIDDDYEYWNTESSLFANSYACLIRKIEKYWGKQCPPVFCAIPKVYRAYANIHTESGWVAILEIKNMDETCGTLGEYLKMNDLI